MGISRPAKGVYSEGGLLRGDYAKQAWFVLLCEYDRRVELQSLQPDGGFSYVDGDDSAVGSLGGQRPFDRDPQPLEHCPGDCRVG